MIDSVLHEKFDTWFSQVRDHSVIKNPWLNGDYASIYVRYSQRILHNPDPILVHCLDISNINVKPKFQRQGIFKAFLAHVEQIGIPIYVEQVINDDLARFFDGKSDYVKLDQGGIPQYFRIGHDKG